MACRKDGKGRVLRKGEHYRKTDGRYSYMYTDPLGKKRTIYAKSLVTLNFALYIDIRERRRYYGANLSFSKDQNGYSYFS